MLLFYHIKLSTQLSFRWCNWYCMICSHFNIGGHPILSVNTQLMHPLASSYQWNGPREPIFTCKLLMIPMQALTYLCLLLFSILLQTTGAICKVLCPWVLFHDTTVIDSKFCSFFGPFFCINPSPSTQFSLIASTEFFFLCCCCGTNVIVSVVCVFSTAMLRGTASSGSSENCGKSRDE